MKLPLSLPYEGAASIEDADGVIIAECIDPKAAQAIVEMVAALRSIAEESFSGAAAIVFAKWTMERASQG